MKWDLFCTASEPTPILVAYIAYHLQQGANHIYVFLETPDPQLSRLMLDEDRVTLVAAGAEDWPELHGRSFADTIPKRQVENGKLAKSWSNADWIGHLDSDEFLVHLPSVLSFLSAQPDTVHCVNVQNGERVHVRGMPNRHIFSGFVRTPFANNSHPAIKSIYGEWSGFLRRGLPGFTAGKCFFRVSSEFDCGIHELLVPAPLSRKDYTAFYGGVGLVHFDGFTAEHWLDKMTRKSDKGRTNHPAVKERQQQVRHLWDIGHDVTKRRKLYNGVKTVGLMQLLRLKRWGHIHRLVCNVPAAVKAQFPDESFDLSPSNIDRELVEHRMKRAGSP